MEGGPQGPRATSATELKAQIEAERLGRPFLVHRDADGEQRILTIGEGVSNLWIGRSSSADVELSFDEQVSTLHAQLEVVGEECTLVDDGLSTNGSYVNEERIDGRRLLRDGDVLRFGRSSVLYRAPGAGELDSTVVAGETLEAAGVSPAQKRVLIELCRPFKDSPPFATPATNQEIADALHLSVDAVKTHMRALFEKFAVEALPQNRKRLGVVERALATGIVTQRDL
jgi:FHA domain-containing protein/regulatory LuxR family protein